MRKHPTLKRHEALAKTIETYRNKPFVWGKSDCMKLARTHVRNMGHRPPASPPYSSIVGARTALKKTGFDTLEGLLDSLLPRITPAAMLPGDIGLIEHPESPFDSVVISLGRKVFCWHEDAETPVMLSIGAGDIKAAWRT